MVSFWRKKAPVLKSAIFLIGSLLVSQNGLAAQEASSSQLVSSYDLYWKGIRVVTVDSTLSLTDATFDHQMTWRTRGMLRWFMKGKTNAQSSGALGDDFNPLVENYSSDGKWGKKTFERTVSYDAGGIGTLLSNTDPWSEENEREPIPEGLDVGPDPVTLTLFLMKAPLALKNNNSTLTLTSFDGMRSMAYDITCKTALVPLRDTSHSDFRGDAKICNVKVKQTGGFSTAPREEEEQDPREQHGIDLLFQKLRSQDLYIPVQGTFSSESGTLKLYLTTINQPLQEIVVSSATASQ